MVMWPFDMSSEWVKDFYSTFCVVSTPSSHLSATTQDPMDVIVVVKETSELKGHNVECEQG